MMQRILKRLLGAPPTHVYDYGMMPAWKKRAYQRFEDSQRTPAVYPVHCWSAGVGGPQEPMTWFSCVSCGATRLGNPSALPKPGCWVCCTNAEWEVADPAVARDSTLRASKGMSERSVRKVLDGP